MSKETYYYTIAKNLEKGGAWLASISLEPNGSLMKAAAFSSAAPAKRWAAETIGRSRLPWIVSEDGKSMTAAVELKKTV